MLFTSPSRLDAKKEHYRKLNEEALEKVKA